MGGLPHFTILKQDKTLACYYPLDAYRSKADGKTIVFSTKLGHRHSLFQLACGQCWGCRLERSRIWAIRCMHEAHTHKNNQYITLTYNDENLPTNSSLHKNHLVNFWKRLRQHLSRYPEHKLCEYDISYHTYKRATKKYKKGFIRKLYTPQLKYYACGEYGDNTQRPHYHAIVFGLKITDKIHHSTVNGYNLYTSKTIERLWTHGHTIIGDVTFESCAYVARYIMKKTLGKDAQYDYQIINSETGEVIGDITQEYTAMSKGIGKQYFEQFQTDMYQLGTDGQCIIRNGIATTTPIYYDNLFTSQSSEAEARMETIKKRRAITQKNNPNNTRERLIVREKLALTIINKKLPRRLT